MTPDNILGLGVLASALAAGGALLGYSRLRRRSPQPDYVSPTWGYRSFHGGHAVDEPAVERLLVAFVQVASERELFDERQVRAWVHRLTIDWRSKPFVWHGRPVAGVHLGPEHRLIVGWAPHPADTALLHELAHHCLYRRSGRTVTGGDPDHSKTAYPGWTPEFDEIVDPGGVAAKRAGQPSRVAPPPSVGGT